MSNPVSVGDDLVRKLEAERDRHVSGYPGPRRDVAELLDAAASQLAAVPAERDALGQQIERMEYSDGDAEDWRHLATNLEAQLKTTREAINRIADFDTGGSLHPDTVQLIRIAGAARRAALNPKAPS